MARRPQDVTDAELDVLRVIWDEGSTTIRAIADRLYPDGGTSEYATVQKLLERLEDKGHVAHRTEGRTNVFRARMGRDDLVARRLRETAEQLCDGSLTPLLDAPGQRGAAVRRGAARPAAARRPPLARDGRKMSALLALVATNALSAGVLAVAAWAAGRFVRRQAVVHGLWLLALLKLVTPPVLPLPILPTLTALLPAPAAPLAVAIPPPTTTAATTEATGALGRAITGAASPHLPPAPRGATLLLRGRDQVRSSLPRRGRTARRAGVGAGCRCRAARHRQRGGRGGARARRARRRGRGAPPYSPIPPAARNCRGRAAGGSRTRWRDRIADRAARRAPRASRSGAGPADAVADARRAAAPAAAAAARPLSPLTSATPCSRTSSPT